ncbi:prepilin-type N-terminal cleavage/methylation domain-containing protein [Patescibacteria group bacterium]|nr:prepilin-type N-terminal cleavage/methylation domain-containing protein [Patescibacteria group bacterium]
MQKGFSLIELLISIGLIALITTFSFVSLGNYSESKQLKLEILNLSSKISEMKVKSLAGQKIDDEIPAGGYCVSASPSEPDSYYLFADKNENYTLDNADIVIEKSVLSKKIKFDLTEPRTVCFKINQLTEIGCLPSGICGENKSVFFHLKGDSGARRSVSVQLNSGAINIDAMDCPAPYRVLTRDGRCVPSCAAGTMPDMLSDDCKCQLDYVQTGFDQLGRRVCSPQ